jgi:hypothetical protein
MGIVRIPLDYYRILGLPIQATVEQLQQAHRDRTQQLPRREFSEAAIATRKQLLDQAYDVLSDPVRRQEYDTSFLAKSYDLLDMGRLGDGSEEENSDQNYRDGVDPDLGVDPYTPSIEIEEAQLIGAMLVLLELGEYELVLRLGRPYLNNGSLSLREGKLGDPEIVSADIVLTAALACLELGREQWQQGQYENAAASLESGQELLLREGVFANLRGEMQSDLFKLRPYRILELVSLPDGQAEARHQGISLLEDMLNDRNGIDGTGDDLSGLSVDDFLRFIQQIRSYLTATEQQVLFEAEARRPSAVATYLAVYALLARGFAQRQPALIRRAKMMLMRLGSHQDVHLEQAVCSLLLGQTEEASRALELSQEFESLSFIRDHSQGSPDLLPGLCLYSERWFQNEVFPHFRDLQDKQASLTEYFADEDVQLYLEELTTEAEPAWTAAPAYASAARRDVNLPAENHTQSVGRTVDQGFAPPRGTATMDVPAYAAPAAGVESLSAKAAASPPVAERQTTPPVRGGRHHKNTQRESQPLAEAVRQQPANGSRPAAARRTGGTQFALRLDRVILLAALGLLGIMLLGFLFGKLLNRPQPQASSSVNTSNQSAQAGVSAQTGFAELASTPQQALSPSATLTEENAPDLIQAWLNAKAAAMGETHEIDRLAQILVEPALTQQKARAEEYQAEDSYWKYEHSDIEIISVETSGAATEDAEDAEDAEITASADGESFDLESPEAEEAGATETADSAEAEQATIEAIVSEKGELFVNGQLDEASSYDSQVRVRYSLVKQEGQWKIESMVAE